LSIPPEFLDEIRARTRLSTLVGRTVKLQRAGNEWKACCPVHNEKTASFYVNDDKGFAHCFGCGFHADAIRWLTETQGLQFLDAVRELAEAAGLPMPAHDPQAAERQQRQAGMHEIMGRAAAAFSRFLGAQVETAIPYLDKRGIGPGTASHFDLGFAPDSRTAIRAALGDVGDEKLIEIGLLVKPDDDREPYDRFRNRIMFPIHDARGRVIGFGGRILGKGEPKYLNSPDTPLFDKGRSLYNIHRAAPAARRTKRVIVVEGYMDVIALHRAGLEEVVAPNGTALTEAQMEILWRLADMPILCFDGDRAGKAAAARAALKALPLLEPGRTLWFAFPPPGLDPDDVLREHGPGAIATLFAEPRPLVDVIWQHDLEAQPLDTPEARAGLFGRLSDRVAAIRNHDVARAYADELKKRFRARFAPRDRQPTPARPNRREKPASVAAKVIADRGIGRSIENAVLVGLLRYPDVLENNCEVVSAAAFKSPWGLKARDVMLDAALGGKARSTESLAAYLTAFGLEDLVRLLDQPHRLPPFSFVARRVADEAAAKEDLTNAIAAMSRR
jgi:DNA primase